MRRHANVVAASAGKYSLGTVHVPLTLEDLSFHLYLQPLGHVSRATVNRVRQDLETTYAVAVTVLKERPLPKAAWYPPRKRWLADKIIALPTGRAEHTFYITTQDVSIPDHGKPNWGIFGLGAENAVVSTFRMHHSNQILQDVTIHEMGHVLGLSHCSNLGCVMQAWSGKTSFTKSSHAFCAACRARLGGKLR